VSGQHAYLHCLPRAYRLFDGAPNGLPSINGTFVNGRPVPPGGHLLQDGDILILAAVRPQAPSLDTPGVAGLRFRALCA
jgi:pSer/pThr/pTyr-binding forkhead associated (FHA) protein